MGTAATSLRKIAGFELIEKIGQGGMGSVFKARQLSLDREVALKILPPSIAKDKQFIERFQREARATAVLNHPNIVQGIDVGQDSATGLWYFAMEFVDGESLKQALKRDKLIPEERALKIGLDVARALQCAERHKMVHRDIKPDNILINSRGETKLADLGLARQTGSDDATLTQSGSTVGTPHYMAPEQIRGHNAEIDLRTDIYALGATLFHLTTGQTPFTGGTPAEIMSKHLTEKTPLAHRACAQVSEATGRLIARMMEKEKNKRPASAADLIELIEKAIEGKSAPTPATARHAGVRTSTRQQTPVEAQPHVGRKRAPITVIVAAVALALVVVAALVIGRGTPGIASSSKSAEPRAPALPPAPEIASTSAPKLPSAPEKSDTTEKLPSAPDKPAPKGNNDSEPHTPVEAKAAPKKKDDAAAAFQILTAFYGLKEDDFAGRAARAEAFAKEIQDPLIAQQARDLASKLNEQAKAQGAASQAQANSAVSRAKALIGYGLFAEEFIAALRKGDRKGAVEFLHKAQGDGSLAPVKQELSECQKSLAWLETIDADALKGLDKVNATEQFDLRISLTSVFPAGKRGEFKVTGIKGGRILLDSAAAGGMGTSVPIDSLNFDCRRKLADLGMTDDAAGRLRRSFALLLSMDGSPGAVKLADVRQELEKAKASGADSNDLAWLSALSDAAEKTAAESAARADWLEIEQKEKAKNWKDLKKALEAFVAARGQTEFAAAKKAEIQALLDKAVDMILLAEGYFYDFNTPESFARFQKDFTETPEGLVAEGGTALKGAMTLRDGKVVVAFAVKPGIKASWYVNALELTLKSRKWEGDWELRCKLHYNKPDGDKSSPEMNLIFDRSPPEYRGNGFHFIEHNSYNRIYAELICKTQFGFPTESGIWRASQKDVARAKTGSTYDLRWVKHDKRLTCDLDGRELVSGDIPDDLLETMAKNPVRLGFSGSPDPNCSLELDDIYFGPPRPSAAPASPPSPVNTKARGPAAGK